MMRLVQGIVFIAGLFFLLLGMVFIWGVSQFATFWLNTYLFGAVLMAYAIPTLWIAATRTYKALIGGGLATCITFGGIGLHLLRLQEPRVVRFAEISLYIAFLALWFLFLGIKAPKSKPERLPLTTQWLFAFVFTLSLLEGLYLVIPLPSYFPWLLTTELSVIYGWVLIGGALFFGWSLLQPIWENGYPLLYALLVFDALLIGPFLSLLNAPVQGAFIPSYLWLAIILIGGTGLWALLELLSRFFSTRKRSY